MHRTEGANNVAGMFTNGPPGTALEEDWHNAVQEEVIAVLTAAGVSPLTAGTDTKDQLAAAIAILSQNAGGTGALIRPKFRWKDADEIYIGAGVYDHRGASSQVLSWNSELTFQAGPGGSNADSVALDASNWFYLYLDDSAIVTLSLNVLTAAQFVMNKTAPTYSHIKHGWYNGNDRCIFAILTSAGSAIIEFLNDNDIIFWADQVIIQALVDIDTVFTDIGALAIPGFSTIGLITVLLDNTVVWSWRTNGQTGAIGHPFAYFATYPVSVRVMTDSSQIIEVKKAVGGVEQISVYSDGWEFPIGM